jgi:membrane protein
VAGPDSRRHADGRASLLAAPNVKQPGFRLVTAGGVVAVAGWVIGSAAFTLYVSNFAAYNKTYGAVGGVIVFLFWLWLTNAMVLLGAEFNAVLERRRHLEARELP